MQIALTLASVGCIEPDFEPQTIVSRPRVLAVIADRPEVQPGDEVRVHALVAGLTDVEPELRWSMCLGGAAFEAGGFGAGGAFGAAGPEQFGQDLAQPGCEAGSTFTTALAVEAGEAVVPGTCADPAEPWRCTEGLVALFLAVGDMGGVPLPLVERILDTVGVALTVNVDVFVEGELVERAFKRVSVTRRSLLTTNPPAPRFAIGDVWMSARGEGGDPHLCVAERGERPVVAGVAEVRLAPDPEDANWLERFPVVAVDGSLIEGEESAYYSWFSTAGEFDPEITVAPARDSVWLSPEALGVHAIWVVVRDGHLGQSACRAEVEVVDVVPAYTDVGRL